MLNPNVSVILPVFNGEKFIGKAIESVLAQKKAAFELIVVDDDSTDDTKLVVQKYQKIDDRVKYTLNKYGEGSVGARSPMAARKYGVSLSKGNYIAFIDSDDFWCDNYKLKKQVDILEENPEYAFVFSDIFLFNENDKLIKDTNFLSKIRKRYRSGYIFFDLLEGNFINIITVLLRKEIIERDKIDLYKDWYVFDYWLWLKIALRHKIYFQNEKTANYCVRSNSLTTIRSFHSIRYPWVILIYDILKEYYSHYYDSEIITKNNKEELSKQLFRLSLSKELNLSARIWALCKLLTNKGAFNLIKSKISKHFLKTE